MVSSEVVDYLNCYARLLECIQKTVELFNGLERARKGLLQRLNFRYAHTLTSDFCNRNRYIESLCKPSHILKIFGKLLGLNAKMVECHWHLPLNLKRFSKLSLLFNFFLRIKHYKTTICYVQFNNLS